MAVRDVTSSSSNHLIYKCKCARLHLSKTHPSAPSLANDISILSLHPLRHSHPNMPSIELVHIMRVLVSNNDSLELYTERQSGDGDVWVNHVIPCWCIPSTDTLSSRAPCTYVSCCNMYQRPFDARLSRRVQLHRYGREASPMHNICIASPQALHYLHVGMGLIVAHTCPPCLREVQNDTCSLGRDNRIKSAFNPTNTLISSSPR
jgi:hypothetical protein